MVFGLAFFIIFFFFFFFSSSSSSSFMMRANTTSKSHSHTRERVVCFSPGEKKRVSFQRGKSDLKIFIVCFYSPKILLRAKSFLRGREYETTDERKTIDISMQNQPFFCDYLRETSVLRRKDVFVARKTRCCSRRLCFVLDGT